MRLLVTGGAGYIGAVTARLLAERGHQVLIVDSMIRGHRHAAGSLPIEIADITDADTMERILRDGHIEAALHFAAFAQVAESVAQPDIYYRNNTGGTLALASAMHRCGVPIAVFSSTAAVYGQPETPIIEESAPNQPTNPYGRSKLLAEQVWRSYAETAGMRVTALRYFNAAGAAPAWGLGEDHDPETHLIPLALKAAEPGDFTLQLYGSDYPTPDGTCIRDYVHVLDLAEAHALAIERLGRQAMPHPFNAINLGTGRGMSVLEVIGAVERATHHSVRRAMAPRRPGDPAQLVASNALAASLLGWAPQRGIDAIVADALQWRRQHPNGYGA